MAIKKKKMGTVIKSMTEENLNETTKVIRNTDSVQQKEITKIALQKGWEAKDYDSFKQYCQGELFDMNYDTLNRHRRVGLVLHTVGGMKAVGEYSSDAIMPLMNFETKKQKKVWGELKKKCGKKSMPKKWLTRARVEKVIEELDKPSKVPLPTKSNSEQAFFDKLENENVNSKPFARRVAECAKDTFSQKACLKMCQLMLKDVADSEDLTEALAKLLSKI
jgi:hypothetical protein